MPKSQKLVQTNIGFATINVLKTTSNVCATVGIYVFISKIMNHETDLLPLTSKSFLEKLTLNFVNVYISTSNNQFLNSLNDLKRK